MTQDFNTWEDYLYPNGTLKNNLGISDPDKLRAAEYRITETRMRMLEERPLKPGANGYDLEYLQRVHHYIARDVYPWAGRLRTVDMVKGGTPFVRADELNETGKRFFDELRHENGFRGLPKDAFVDRFARFYADLNALHPFREGNGRSTRIVLSVIAREAGYSLDQTRIDNDKGAWNEAAKRSATYDLSGIKEIFNEAIRPTRALAFERMPESVATAAHPELAEVFAVLKSFDAAMRDKYPVNLPMQQRLSAQAKATIVRRLDEGHTPPLIVRSVPTPARER
jgi:cell filamentation protein